MSLKGKKIILGVCGSIAAYKSLVIVRLLVKQGAEVQVLMTPAATAFISPLSFSTLSQRPVYTSVMDDDGWNSHVALGLWADLMIIAPTTATTLAKMSAGIADNMIVACYLSARCPVFLAPAMDLDMWNHPSTQRNIDTLQKDHNHFIWPTHGPLASGLVGTGRLAEPGQIVSQLATFISTSQSLKGHKVLINAGPTREAIDPVRFLSNPSTGKMGIALATIAINRGAKVHLVLGPTDQEIPADLDKLTRVTTAQEMYQATTQGFKSCTICILTAAVADYRPSSVASQKIKKSDRDLQINLVRTKDIAAHLGTIKKDDQQVLVGFALETEKGTTNAYKKLLKKNLDLIVLNSLADKGAGFQQNTNKITIIDRDNKLQKFKLKSKEKVAADIFDAIEKIIL